MPGDVLPDPRLLPGPTKESPAVQVLQIHRTTPDTVQIGHFAPGGAEVVDDVVSRTAYLDAIQQACARLGDALEVRFYDHGLGEFDAFVLDHLGEIRRLSIDGLALVRHPEAIGRLPKLTFLRFGPRRIDDPGILGAVGVHRLDEFTLASTPTPAIDLAPRSGISRSGRFATSRISGTSNAFAITPAAGQRPAADRRIAGQAWQRRARAHLSVQRSPAGNAEGFFRASAVKSFFVYDGRLDLHWSQLPRTLTHFRLMTTAMKGREAHNAEVRAKGLIPDVHLDSQFFYK